MATNSKERIEFVFPPNLEKGQKLSWREFKVLGRWGMDVSGVPVPLDGDIKAAVWQGVASKLGEAPVLAVAVPAPFAIKPHELIWYCGVLPEEALGERVHSPLIAFEAAEFGPYKLMDTFGLLRSFVPLEHYPDPE